MVNSLGQSLAPENSQAVDDSYDRALQVAYRFVGFRPRSVGEVRHRLSKDFAADVVDRVVSTFIRYGYLDDAEFARQWRESRERRNPRGATLLRRELRDKGIAEGLIEATLDDVDEAENAYRAGKRRAETMVRVGGIGLPCIPTQNVGLSATSWIRRRCCPSDGDQVVGRILYP